MALITIIEGTTQIDSSQITKEDKVNIDTLKLVVPETNSVAINDEIDYQLDDNTTIFTGYVQKIEFGNGSKTCTIYDKSSVLLHRNVNQIYTDIAPEEIIENVLTDYAPELTYISTINSGLIIPTYTAKNKLAWDVVTEMAEVLLASFSTDVLGNLRLELEGENLSIYAINSTDGSTILKGGWTKNADQIINSVTVEGEDKQSFEPDPQLFNGTGSQTEFILDEIPVDVKVEYPIGTTLTGYVRGSGSGDYYVDRSNKKIVFDSAPASGTNNIRVTYSYSVPINVRRRDFTSIETYGQHDKSYTKSFITTRSDASAYANYIISKYKDPLLSSTWILKDQIKIRGFSDWVPNESISVTDTNNNISQFLVIQKVVRNYPGTTEITVGTPEEDIIYWQKEAQVRITQLEEQDDNSDLLNEDEYVINNVKISISTEVTQITKIEKGDAWVLDDVVNSQLDASFKLDGGTITNLL